MRTRLCFAVITAALMLTPSAICSAFYTVTDLGTLEGGTFSGAYGLNNAGQVVGVSGTAGSTTASHDGLRAFVWQNGVMTDLGTLGGTYSYGLGINDAGQIVGESSPAGVSPSHAFLWQNNTMSDLGTVGETSIANAINSSGQIVGTSQATDSPARAVRWQNAVVSDVGGPASNGQAINDSGQVVGWATVYPEAHPLNGEEHPFVWQPNGSATDLAPLGPQGYALGINNVGQAVGSSSVSTSSHAFLWQNGVMTDLETLGGPYSAAYSITDDGQILGDSSPTSDTSTGHAFLWDLQHGMRDLNGLINGASGWTLLTARQMNDAGQIVGTGINPNGFQHGYLLTPSVSGDFNLNGIVDAADYVLWRNTMGELVSQCSGADANCNGFIDNSDYQAWKQNYGASLPSGNGVAIGVTGASAIPEPASLLLLTFATIATLAGRHRKSVVQDRVPMSTDGCRRV